MASISVGKILSEKEQKILKKNFKKEFKAEKFPVYEIIDDEEVKYET